MALAVMAMTGMSWFKTVDCGLRICRVASYPSSTVICAPMSTKLQGILSRAFGHGVSRPLYLALSLLFYVEQLLKICHGKKSFSGRNWFCLFLQYVYILVCHEATGEMREGPSESACRSRFQTTLSCCGKEPWW